MSARIGEALRELEQDMTGLRLSPAAEVRARGRARSRRRAAVLAGVAAVTVTGGAATMATLSGPATPMPAGGGAATPSAAASAACQADPPVRLDVVFRPGAGAPQIGEVDYRIGQARGDTGCAAVAGRSRPGRTATAGSSCRCCSRRVRTRRRSGPRWRSCPGWSGW